MCHSSILNMKLFLILSITCLAGVDSIFLDSKPETKDLDAKITELCAKELNTSADKYKGGAELFAFIGGNADEETTCMVACHIRKLITQKIAPELTGSSNKETLYNGFNKLAEEAFKVGFGGRGNVKREDIVDKVTTCYTIESTECGFFECLDASHPPIHTMATYYWFHSFRSGLREAIKDQQRSI